ncbi:MAG: T9SS type A sorting domain-containing protein [Flavobacteriales bacterium]|nr:T9SS type A sorting domain-containing protein [Flavobacteriales bacterium]
MKKTIAALSLVFLVFFGNQLHGQNANIPDDNFLSALLNHKPVIDLNGDWKISIQEAQAFNGTLDIYFKGIFDLSGIEVFTNISGLNCSSNNLTSVDFSHNTQLKLLSCGNNQISTLNISALTQLETLNCYNNLLTQLDVSALTQLVELGCYNNQITELNTSKNKQLQLLFCSNNQIQNLDVSANTSLENLTCNNNKILNLALTNNSDLSRLDCSYNLLESLNVANGNNSNMTEMRAYDNPNLSCIQHDNGFTKTNISSGWHKDDAAIWSVNCTSLSTNNTIFNEEEDNVRLFPNPARDIVTIKNKNLKSISIYDMQGKQVLSTTNNSFIVKNLASGVYLVNIENTNGSFTFKKLYIE